MGTGGAAARPRKEQRREQMRCQLRAALVELAAQCSFNELRVEQIAAEAGLSRSAFYFYYRDKSELLVDATAQVGNVMFDRADRWYRGAGEPPALLGEALAGITEIWAANSDLLQMTLEVRTYDQDVRAFWDGLLAEFCTTTAERIHADQATGNIPADLDAASHSEILILATERYLQGSLGADDRSPGEVAEVLTSLWTRVLYPST